MTCEPLTVNGIPLSEWGGMALLDYSVGETELQNPFFLGINRTTPLLLKTMFGARTLTLTIQFEGRTLHDAKMRRSRFNAEVAGKSEIYIPDDGFFYSCICQSLGEERLVGQCESNAKVEATYTFTAFRHGATVIESVPPWQAFKDGLYSKSYPQINCLSTVPQTDCKLTTTVDADAPAFVLGGAEFGPVSAGDVLTVDGIRKLVLKNGEDCSASMHWAAFSSFPSLTPGENTIITGRYSSGVLILNEADVVVEYTPTYL
jgi:hypothetical protein